MKNKRIHLVCFFIASAITFSLLGCANDISGKSYTGDTETSSSVETEHTHKYTAEVVASSCMEKGYTSYECDCGHAYIEDAFTEKLPDANSEAVAPADPEVVYLGATKDYLLPFEDFSRERKYDPEFVMIHFISAVVLSREDPYNMDTIRSIFKDYEVSVHYIIDRNGDIYCYIPENLVAYHAGYGTWGNDPKYTDLLNEYAIGIELVAIGSQIDMQQYLTADTYSRLDQSLIGFTDAQYDTLKKLVRDICERNKIPMDREHIIGHEEYSPDKTDPGELFDWERLLS